MINHLKIERKEVNTPTVSSLYFRWDRKVKPGQFVMVWVPGFGEVPMSISSIGDLKCITVKAYGDSTRKLIRLKEGDFIHLRGPYGRPFSEPEGDILLIGGGSGMASLRTLIGPRATGIIASRTSDELLFSEEFEKEKRIEVTEDGIRGLKGLVLMGLDQVNVEDYSCIYVCGPEKMLKAVYERIRGHKVRAEFSLERSMKCGIGICDSCSINGYQVCVDGPTFSIEELGEMTEFGTTKLLSSGRRVQI